MIFSGMQLPPKKNTGNKKSVPPGDYDGIIKDAKENVDYQKGMAIDIYYQLTQGEKVYTYKETFIVGYPNDRTEDFDRYLQDNGIDTSDLANLVGIKEKLVLKKVIAPNGRTYVNIVEREFVK